jgi:DNA-binding IclR family transcriptional regulator
VNASAPPPGLAPSKTRQAVDEQAGLGKGARIGGEQEPADTRPVRVRQSGGVSGRSVVSKVAAILHSFDGAPHHTVSDLARSTGLPLSTAYRLLRELVDTGVLHRTEQGLYSLSRRSPSRTEPGSTADLTIRDLAHPVMHDLLAVTRRPVYLAVLSGLAGDHIDLTLDSPLTSQFGERPPLPLHATATGKVLLAFSGIEVFDSVVRRGLHRYTGHTVTDVNELRAELFTVRRNAAAVNWGEFDDRRSGMAVAVFGRDSRVIAALGLQISDRTELTLFQHALRVAGRTLSRSSASHVQPIRSAAMNT